MALFPEDVSTFVRAAGPTPTGLQRAMEEYGRVRGSPIIGPELGGLLAIVTRMVGATHVLEFGSGSGYSATWFLRGLPDDGEVVLTELDDDLAEPGRDFFERAGEADRVTCEVGDAMAVVERHDGPFDVVFVDHETHRTSTRSSR
jgi:predicted O-methyltransferase YrrM